jgi:hypothetical protein
MATTQQKTSRTPPAPPKPRTDEEPEERDEEDALAELRSRLIDAREEIDAALDLLDSEA